MASIQGVYIALFGRPADPLGLAFFNSATNNGANLTAIGDLASTAEYQSRFTGQSSTQIITTIYRSLFNRDPDLAGLTFFATALANKTLTINNIAIAIFDGAQGSDVTIRDLKVAAANAFTAQIDTVAEINGYTGTAAAASGVAFITGVTTTAPTAEQVSAAVVTATTQPQIGRTVTLTNNVDGPGAISPAIETTGTSGDDLYLASTNTLAGDFIDGKGGIDTVRLTSTGNVNATLTAVERIEVLATGAANVVLNGSSGITTLALANGSAAVVTDFQGLSAIAALEVTSQSLGSATVSYNATVVSGTTDTQKIALNGYGLSTGAAGTITVNGVETFDVTATGTNRFTTLAGDKLETVKVAGAGTFRADTDLANTVKTFDGSTATGAIRVGFAAGQDVNVKTGTGNDRINFAGATDFTTKDIVDAGTGTDTLVIAAGDVSAAANEQLKALNAVKGVEVLQFNGDATLNNTTLTNAEITKFIFNGAGTDAVTNAGTALYAFSSGNAGNATFTLAGTNTTLNLASEGVAKTATVAHDDADVGTVNTGAALTVNLASTGATDATINLKAALNGANFNDVGVVTATANATFNLTGDANTQLAGFANAINFQAGTATGTIAITGSGNDDIIVTGTKAAFISAGNGADTIDITKSATVAGDVIDLAGIVGSANRDTVTGFQVGATGDLVRVTATDTTAATAAGATAAFQDVNSNTGNIVFNTATNDVLELSFAIAGTTLAASNGANALNGTNLLAAIGTLAVSADQDKGYIVAYQGGNAYLYYVAESNDGGAAVAAADIALVGTFNGVAVGAFDPNNYLLV